MFSVVVIYLFAVCCSLPAPVFMVGIASGCLQKMALDTVILLYIAASIVETLLCFSYIQAYNTVFGSAIYVGRRFSAVTKNNYRKSI